MAKITQKKDKTTQSKIKIASSNNFLTEYQQDIENELLNLLDSQKLFSNELLDSIKYSVLDGGKRIRPILGLITAEAILKNPEKIRAETNPALGLALAIELIHCGSLIHDDLPCMDDDDLRRGRPSNHKKFNEATALLAGDFLLCYPIEVLITKSKNILELKNFDAKINLATTKLSKAIQDMIIGQALDLQLTNSEKQNDDNYTNQLEIMEKLKTGALLTASVEIAAILANADENQIDALKFYAQNLGQAFQIVDDILDVSASTEELGKTSGKDAKQNKLTYVKQFGLEKSKEICHSLISQAKVRIKEAGLFTDKLNLIADYVISRTY